LTSRARGHPSQIDDWPAPITAPLLVIIGKKDVFFVVKGNKWRLAWWSDPMKSSTQLSQA
jgi:hypothetical protein